MSEPDIKQSRAEKINADIGFQKKKFFAQNYDPLNVMELDDASSARIEKAMTGRAAADSMQQMAKQLADTSRLPQQQGDPAAAANVINEFYQKNVNAAQSQAKQFQNKRQAAALGVGVGQAADNSKSMALLARLGASEAISGAKSDQMIASGLMQGGAAFTGNVITNQADAFRSGPNYQDGDQNWATRMSDFLKLGA